MDVFKLVFIILGGAFIGVGAIISTVFIAVGGMGAFVLIPFFFVILGAIFIGVVIKMNIDKNTIKKKGQKYSAKIYGYVENKSYTVNGDFTVNTKVHFFDKSGIEREVIIPTAFSKGSSAYPIGMTIDIYEYNGSYGFDEKSVRNEILPRESELMDDIPVEPDMIKMVAVSCKSCGSTFQAAKGYTARCPYCSNYINAEG